MLVWLREVQECGTWMVWIADVDGCSYSMSMCVVIEDADCWLCALLEMCLYMCVYTR